MTDLANEKQPVQSRGPSEDDPCDSTPDDDLTIDGSELMAQLALPTLAPPTVPPPPDLSFPLGSTLTPSRSSAACRRWAPPPSKVLDAPAVPTRPGRLQVGVLTVALLVGIVLTVLVLGPEATP